METLSVFTVEPSISYSGGCVIVVAHDEVEARKMAIDEYKNSFASPFECWTSLDGEEYPRVTKLDNVFANYDTAKIIADYVYIE